MPVYNGERTITLAIESILRQSFEDFILIISDNCSSDSTPEICRKYAEDDLRIHYVRQGSNIGAEMNFCFVLQMAQSEYFMWAAADDTRSSDFIELNLGFLETHPEYVCSVCPVRFNNENRKPALLGDSSLDDDDRERRFLDFLQAWHANGRCYSLFVRSVLQNCAASFDTRAHPPFLGADWEVVLRACLVGKTHRCDSGFLVFGSRGISSSKSNFFSAYRRHWHEWFLPFETLSSRLWRLTDAFSYGSRFRLLAILVRLNLHAAVRQAVRSLARPAIAWMQHIFK